MSFLTYTRPRRAAVSPAVKSVGPVTRAIRGLRPNEMPSWEIREAEMRKQEAADLLALRRRVAKAVAQGIDFLDATGGDPEMEGTGEDDEDTNDAETVNEDGSDCDRGEPSLCGLEVGPGDSLDLEGPDDNGMADMAGWGEQRTRFLDMGGDANRAGGRS